MNELGPGSIVAGKYELKEELGRGGFGTVWRALHLDLKDSVAIKILNFEVASDPEGQRRFLREFRATTSFVHPYAVQLRDFGRDSQEDLLYFTMDLIEGSTLRELFTTGPLAPQRVIEIGSQILEVLEKAHEAGFAHRDLKPANLILTRNRKGDEEIRVLDFGIAKALTTSSELTQLTRRKAVIGTVAYMSPEQAKGVAVDHLTDLYSLGVVLYEALAGRLPIAPEPGAENPVLNLHHRVINVEPEPLEGVGDALAAVVLRALAKDPQQRHASATEMRAALLAARGPSVSRTALTAMTEEIPESRRLSSEDPEPLEEVPSPEEAPLEPAAETERFAPAALYCPTCGAGNSKGGNCGSCRESLTGQAYDETFAISLSGSSFAEAPDRCACCLQASEQVKDHLVHEASVGRIELPIPWCEDCYQTSTSGFGAFLVALALGMLAGGLIFYWARNPGEGLPLQFKQAFVLAAVGSFLATAVVSAVLFALTSRPDRPGHVSGCNAIKEAGLYEVTTTIGSTVGPPTPLIKIQFANRAFAELYREVNDD